MTADIHALVGAYVLDAVDDLERAAVERHLRECEDCRQEADELRAVAARLADGAWSVPPPGLKTNVLAEIATTRQLQPAVPRSNRRGMQWRRLTAAAAVVVAIGGASTAAYAVQEGRVRGERAEAERARASEERVRSILAATDLVIHEQTVDGGGRVTVASSRLRNAGVIMLAAASAPADGRVYQLWTIRGQTPASAGVLQPGQSSVVQIVDGLPGAASVGVTVEPAGGSPQPTLPLVAGVKIT
ncbi:MAG: anti-sigma factor [Actinoplanes sp.]